VLEVVAVVSQRSAGQAAATLAREAPELAATAVADGQLTRAVERAGGADVVLLATDGHLEDLEDQIVEAFDCGLSVVCIGEESIYPGAVDPEAARRLEQRALDRGVAMVGTGANPGFVMDYLPIVLTASVWRWDRIMVRRASDLSAYGETVQRSMGIGLDPRAFDEALKAGQVKGHVGFELSLALIGRSLGLELAIVEESCRPIIRDEPTTVDGETFAPGTVVGVDHACRASSPYGRTVTLEHPQRLGRASGEPPMEDLIEVEGDPSVRLRIPDGLDGGAATVALMLNLIPALLEAEPGLHTIASLPLRAGGARRAD
jgi:hypothetical protein